MISYQALEGAVIVAGWIFLGIAVVAAKSTKYFRYLVFAWIVVTLGLSYAILASRTIREHRREHQRDEFVQPA